MAFFDKRVLVFTGKGGVGKTTLCAATALAAVKLGKRAIICEVGATESLSFILDCPRLSYEPRLVGENLWAMKLNPYDALEEYLVKQVKIKSVVRQFLKNRIIHYLAEAAPGWRELITLGKIMVLEAKWAHKKPVYDVILVDAPATGHGISFLRVPQVVLSVLKFGPIKTNTERVQKLFTDRKRTLLNVVTLLEEMPVNEAVEIHKAASQVLRIPFGQVFANQVLPPLFANRTDKTYRALRDDDALRDAIDAKLSAPFNMEQMLSCAEAERERGRLQREHQKRLEEAIGARVIEVPQLFARRLGTAELNVLADLLVKRLEAAK